MHYLTRHEDPPYHDPVPIYSFQDARERMEANYARAEYAMAQTFDNMELELTNRRQQHELEQYEIEQYEVEQYERPPPVEDLAEQQLMSARERFDAALMRSRPRAY